MPDSADAYNASSVLHAIFTGWLWRSVVEDAIRKVQQLGRKLVALAERLAGRLPVDRQRVLEALGINAGITATCAMCPRPTTPYRIVRCVAITVVPP